MDPIKCRGCFLTRKKGQNFCNFFIFRVNEMCPCNECLVKITCKEMCEKRIKMGQEIRILLEGE